MIGALKKLSYLLDRQSKVQFTILFILLMIKAFLDGFGIGLIAPYIAAIGDPRMVFGNDIFIKINAYLKIQSNTDLIIFLSTVLISFFLVKNAISLFVMYFQSRLIFSKRSLQGKRLLSLYMHSPYSYHLDHNTAELDRNLRFENGNVYGFVQSFFLLLSNVLLTLSIFVVLLIANWQAVLTLGIVIITLSALFLKTTGKYSNKFGRKVQESQLYIGQAIKEGLYSIIETKLHGIESFFPNRYFKHIMENAKANWRQATISSTPTLFFEILAVAALAGMIMILSLRNVDIVALLPILGLFSFAFIRLIPSVTAIIRSLQQIRFYIPSVDVVYSDFYNLRKLVRSSNKKDSVPVIDSDFNHISIKDLSFSYQSSDPGILSDLTIDIPKGQSVGITGPSGSGKTTFINLMLGLLKPTSGGIYLDDNDIFEGLTTWRSLIGYVPQFITLLDASIKENIALGLEGDEINEERVWKAARKAHLDGFIKDLPEQLNTFIGENGMRLSGGQRQRLGLARALYRNPAILVFDEATSSLDVDTEKKITKEIEKLSGVRTLIIVAHRISTIKNCDVIYYLKEGRIVSSGSYAELIRKDHDFNSLTLHAD